MNPAGRRIIIGLALIALLVGIGTVGYATIEGMSLFDSLYMTVITITTVGYEEVKPLDTHGRIFTMIIIFTGVGSAYYVFAAVTETVVGGQLREMMGRSAMSRRIRQLEGHVIVCGYGRFGRIVVNELSRDGLTVVVIEKNPEFEPELVRSNELYIIGSALDEQILEEAGVATARDIVVATASDPDNVFISLSARAKNAAIRIHARAESEIGLKHLQLAGADRAISSYHWSAMRIANAIARPSIVDFLNLVLPGLRGEEFSIEEVRVRDRSRLAGTTVADIEHQNERVRIVGLKRGLEPLSLIPGPQTEVRAGDLLIAIGALSSLRHLAEIS